MPRTKPLIERKGEEIVALLWGTMALQGTSAAAVAKKAKIDPATLSRRKKKPEDFTVGELMALGRALAIPVDTLRQALKY